MTDTRNAVLAINIHSRILTEHLSHSGQLKTGGDGKTAENDAKKFIHGVILA
jgi:hypothetical protein